MQINFRIKMRYIYLFVYVLVSNVICLENAQARTYDQSREENYAFIVLITEVCKKSFPELKEEAKNLIDAFDFRLKVDPGYSGFSEHSPETKNALIKMRSLIDKNTVNLQQCKDVFENGYFGLHFRNVHVRPLPVNESVLPQECQKYFPSSSYDKEFIAWQSEFINDLFELFYKIEHDDSALRALLPTNNNEAINNLFPNSVDRGEKGLAFKRMILSDMFGKSQGVIPETSLFIHFALGDGYPKDLHLLTRAVGYGGKFKDGENEVELFYISPNRIQQEPLDELEKNELYSVFSPMHLPKLGMIERNAWPALVFIRTKDNKLLLYGMSQEIDRLLQRSYNLQIF
jgi:hypothetical protein